jgi:plastocyanin
MRHRRPGRTTAVALSLSLAALVLGSGCGSDHNATASSGTTQPPGTLAPVQSGAVKVSAVDNNFQAQDITVTAGSTVTWTNAGRNDHNVTPTEGSAFGVATDAFKPGASYTATFSQPGTYHYFCSIHGTAARGMVGTVTVVAQ